MELSSYISGFVDGEGCFCVSFQPSVRHRFGWEIRPSFSVSQNEDRAEVLHIIKEFWKCGSIRPDRSDRTLKYEVRNVSELVGKVIPHFERYPLISSKQREFLAFKKICELMFEHKHLELIGMTAAIKLAFSMNPSGKRKYSCNEILNSLRSDERIVYYTGNRDHE